MLKINKLNIVLIITIMLCSFSVNGLLDSNPSNNVKNITVNVFQTKKLNITFIPVDNPNNFNLNVDEFVNFFNKTYPIADDSLLVTTGNSYITTQAERTNISRLLFNIAKFSAILGTKTRTVGVVPKDWFKTFTNKPDAVGFAYISLGIITLPSGLAEARDTRQIAAHEIGHTFGLCDEHTATDWDKQDVPLFRCPNGDGDDNNILDANCEPQGCPTSTLGKLVPWNNSNNFINMTNLMGSDNQEKAWISNESYVHLFTKFLTTPLVAQHALIINGIINRVTGTIELFPSYIIENAEITQQETNISGNYTIEIIDTNGIITSKINFTPSFLDIGFNGSTVETNTSFFIVIMNFSSTDKGVKAKETNIVKAEVNRTPNTPTINITTQLSNQVFDQSFAINWNASDLDNDTIQYAILISSDNGNTFSTLEIDYPNKSLTINSTNFVESNQYKLKILATDGINTGNDTTDAFTISHPNLTLSVTSLSSLHSEGTLRIFEFIINNTGNSNLTNINWSLNTGQTIIDSANPINLSAGKSVLVYAAYNYTQAGAFIVTASATDGTNQDSKSVTINVNGISVSNLSVFNVNETKRIFEIVVRNNLLTSLSNVSWRFDTKNNNIINSTSTAALQSNKEAFVYIGYNFTTIGTFNVNASARNGSLTDSRNLTIIV